jgi:flagellar biosynthesis/type III secretory pathway protein FliH
MSAPRRVTPPSAPVAPRTRPPIASLPWNLAEFNSPTVSSDLARSFTGMNNGCSAADVTSLREQMQEQQVRLLAEARRAAFEEGRGAGRAEAELAADRRVADAVSALSEAAGTIRQHQEHYAGILEENLTALACVIARQVIQRDVQLDPSQIRKLVQDALAEFPQEHALRVRLHPADHALLAGDSSYPEVSWVADPRVVRGGCVVEGRERIVDGRVDLALEQVFRRLTGTDR